MIKKWKNVFLSLPLSPTIPPTLIPEMDTRGLHHTCWDPGAVNYSAPQTPLTKSQRDPLPRDLAEAEAYLIKMVKPFLLLEETNLCAHHNAKKLDYGDYGVFAGERAFMVSRRVKHCNKYIDLDIYI